MTEPHRPNCLTQDELRASVVNSITAARHDNMPALAAAMQILYVKGCPMDALSWTLSMIGTSMPNPIGELGRAHPMLAAYKPDGEYVGMHPADDVAGAPRDLVLFVKLAAHVANGEIQAAAADWLIALGLDSPNTDEDEMEELMTAVMVRALRVAADAVTARTASQN
jgi:hypothetical protein